MALPLLVYGPDDLPNDALRAFNLDEVLRGLLPGDVVGWKQSAG